MDEIRFGSGQTCINPTDVLTETCGQLSYDLETALLQDKGNLFRMRRTFFHSPTAAPVLVKVVYIISFTDNVTNSIADEEIPYCSNIIMTNTDVNGESLVEDVFNVTAINNYYDQVILIYGWTSSRIYTVFHPSVLNLVQVQTAFTILRMFHWATQEQYSPEADAFFWTGEEPLPTLYFNMNIASLSCIPNLELLESVIMVLNTFVSFFN